MWRHQQRWKGALADSSASLLDKSHSREHTLISLLSPKSIWSSQGTERIRYSRYRLIAWCHSQHIRHRDNLSIRRMSLRDIRSIITTDHLTIRTSRHSTTNTGNRYIIRRRANIFTGFNRLRYSRHLATEVPDYHYKWCLEYVNILITNDITK